MFFSSLNKKKIGNNNFVNRLQDIQINSTDNPIFGIKGTPDCSLKEAIEDAQKKDPELEKIDLSGAIYLANWGNQKRLAANPYNLTVDELAAIHLYTQETPFYRILNERLRSEKRQLLVPFFRYIKLLLKGLYKLPSIKKVVYRGVSKDLSSSFNEGKEMIWWSFTSTTSKIKVTIYNLDCLFVISIFFFFFLNPFFII